MLLGYREPDAKLQWFLERQGASPLVMLYLELSKARLSGLVLLTAAVGYLLASLEQPGGLFGGGLGRLWWTLAGTGLAAAGANALNQWLERKLDAKMERTRRRPLPSGRIGPASALLWGLAASAGGIVILAGWVHLLPAALAAVVVTLYTLVYTPLKRRSTFCTLAGAICGAIPPMIGWTAATGRLDAGAWLLGFILFVWQIPHSFALAWMYRDDYRRAGFRILPVVDGAGELTHRVLVLFSLILVPLGLTLSLLGLAGPVFAAGSVLLSGGWLALGLRLYRHRTVASARSVFLASLIYLPLLLGLLLADYGPSIHGSFFDLTRGRPARHGLQSPPPDRIAETVLTFRDGEGVP